MAAEEPTMQMVPSLLKEENKGSDDYEPKVVSLGPYHHGREKLKFVEDFKPKAVEMFIGDSGIEHVFMAKILGDIWYARSCYLEEFTRNYSDHVFARMMLQDACVILNYIGPTESEKSVKKGPTIDHLGTVVYTSIKRDMYLLENQVPFWILKMLVFLRYDDGQRILKDMETSCFNMFFHDNDIETPNATMNLEPEPFHLLEIFRRVVVPSLDQGSTASADRCCDINNLISCLEYCCCCRSKKNITPALNVFRSVTDLKSKGIHFRASGIKSLEGVRFSPTDFFQSAKLKLPSWNVTMYTRVFFMNMIAYEFSPYNFSMPKSVTAYVSFMKLLVDTKEDVKELREKEIIINSLGSDEQVVQLYNALNTYEAEDSSTFWDVKRDIEKHYNSKAKTWMAELRTKYFNNPWSIIAFAASIFFLCTDIVQTYYAVHPNGGGNGAANQSSSQGGF